MDFVIGFAVFAPFPILGVLCWIFWRAAKRDAAEAQAGLKDAQSIPK
jgi:cbb3-type cytochrome oxidase subunit 3